MNPGWSFITSVLQIVLIDIVLSGDNAVVIAMASHRLPLSQRRLAIFFGAGGAIGLRVLFTWIVTLLLNAPLLRFSGGLILVWISIKLFLQEETGTEEQGHAARQAGSLLLAVWAIIVADFVMSLDNMLAVGGASGGDWRLILFGLLLSIIIIMTCSVIIAELMNRFPILVAIGAGIIALTAGEMIVRDGTAARFVLQRSHVCVSGTWHQYFKRWFGGTPTGLDHRHWIGNAIIAAVVLVVITCPYWSKPLSRHQKEPLLDPPVD